MDIRYINLERSVDRKHRMQAILKQHLGDSFFDRSPGVVAGQSLNEMSLSVTGCFLAHYNLLMSINKTTLILEDDVLLCQDFGKILIRINEYLKSSTTDVIFLGQTVHYRDLNAHIKLLRILKRYQEHGRQLLLDANTFYRYGTFGYVVNHNALPKIQALLSGLDLSKSAMPMDDLMRNWIVSGELKGGVAFPYLVGIDSTLETTMHDRSGAREHSLCADLVNLYLYGYKPKPQGHWESILKNNPDLYALELCSSIYSKLNSDF
jgi:GR25 family glycosyltransferase involved in LPS biosynthesis